MPDSLPPDFAFEVIPLMLLVEKQPGEVSTVPGLRLVATYLHAPHERFSIDTANPPAGIANLFQQIDDFRSIAPRSPERPDFEFEVDPLMRASEKPPGFVTGVRLVAQYLHASRDRLVIETDNPAIGMAELYQQIDRFRSTVGQG